MAKLEFDIKRVIPAVEIDLVRPNTWNPKSEHTAEYDRIKRGIQLKGLQGFVVVREIENEADAAKYEIIDGQQRWTACKELGYTSIPVYNQGKVSEKEARELTIWYQEQVPFNEIDTAILVSELLSNYEDLELPYSDMELKHYQDLAEFSMDDYKTGGAEEDDESSEAKTIKVVVTDAQYRVIRNAIDSVVEQDECSEGQALERIAADFLSGFQAISE